MDGLSSEVDRAAEHDAAGSAGRRRSPAGDVPAGPAAGTDAVARRPPGPGAGREPRQRWRITFARDEVPPERAGRPLLDDWHEAVRASSLPVATIEDELNRPKLAFAAPLPAAARGEAELVDLWLLERLPLWQIRESLADRLPAGHRWIGAEDIWLGAPPLPGQVVAAEWRIGISTPSEGLPRLAAQARAILAAETLPRARVKGGVSRTYDLRPLIADVSIEPGADAALRVVTRFDPTLGTGRPEEVVAVLADRAGTSIEVRWMIRERLLLNEPAGGSRSAPTATDTLRRPGAGASRAAGPTRPAGAR